MSTLVKINTYYFACFHANPASTYYTYVSDEVEQFAWDHIVNGRARICTQNGITPKAVGLLRHQINMPESPLSKCCGCSDGEEGISGWARVEVERDPEGFVNEGALELVLERCDSFDRVQMKG